MIITVFLHIMFNRRMCLQIFAPQCRHTPYCQYENFMHRQKLSFLSMYVVVKILIIPLTKNWISTVLEITYRFFSSTYNFLENLEFQISLPVLNIRNLSPITVSRHSTETYEKAFYIISYHVEVLLITIFKFKKLFIKLTGCS